MTSPRTMVARCIAGVAGAGCLVAVACMPRGVPATPPAADAARPNAFNALTAAEAAEGWRLLFDGRTLNGWHGLGYTQTPPGMWIVADGAIEHAAKGKSPVQADGQPIEGFDLISDDVYRDFDLRWE